MVRHTTQNIHQSIVAIGAASRFCINSVFILVLPIFLATVQTQAGNLNLELPQVELAPAILKKGYEIDLGLQNEKFSAAESALNGYNSFTDAKLRAKGQAGFFSAEFLSIRLYADLGATYSANITNFATGYVPEVYATVSSPHAELTVGRRFFNWSELDSNWQLGLWQSDFRWNYLQPIEQGLFGAFLDLHTSEWKLLLYASPLFIPEQSAPFNISNGQINSQSPWFSPPAKYVQLFSGRANIVYNLVAPPTSDIVKQVSVGGALQWNPKPFSIKVSYIHKPRNALSLPVDGYLALQPGGSNAPVFIYPKVIFHSLAALDLNYQQGMFRAWLSALTEIQDTQNFDSNLTYQILSNQSLFSPGMEWMPFTGQYSMKFSSSFLFQSGGEVSEVGSLSSPGTNIFSYPINFRKASQLRIMQPLLRSNEHLLDLNLKWIEEFNDQSSLMMAELNYQMNYSNLFIGTNLLGSGAPASNSGFLPRFRGNSLAYAGASLQF